MRVALRRLCLLTCGSVCLFIIVYSYAWQSHSGTGTTKQYKSRPISSIRKYKVIHQMKTTIEPDEATRGELDVGENDWFQHKVIHQMKTTTEPDEETSDELDVGENDWLQHKVIHQMKTTTEPDEETSDELDVGENDWLQKALKRKEDTDINNTLDITEDGLEDKDTGPLTQASEADKQRQTTDIQANEDFDDLFGSVTKRKTKRITRLKSKARLSSKADPISIWYINMRRTKINSFETVSEAEVNKLLKSELEAAKTTPAPKADVTSRCRSAGKTILILGYHRTGSTLIGTTFKVYPGTFYLFEPLHILASTRNLTFINGTRIPNLHEHYPMNEARVLRSLLSCDLHQLPLEVLMMAHHVIFKDSLEHTVFCMQRYLSHYVRGAETRVGQYIVNNRTSAINKLSAVLKAMNNAETFVNGMITRCLKPAIDSCLKAPVRVYKFILLRMPAIKNILRDTNDVGIIHLLRDPRGNIPSQADLIIPNLFRKKMPDFFENPFSVRRTLYVKEFISVANNYCSDVRNDIATKKHYFKKYIDRIIPVVYDRFAAAPLTTAKGLHTFAGLPFLKLAEDFLWHLTLSGHRDRCDYCVERGNSTYSAFKWRKTINSTQLHVIDELCEDLYSEMGLRELRTLTEVRNTSVPILF